ncbi:hypothetical protein D9758_011165 [Tetrapyrgos nigripes]|uniref:RRM domain-containing protein n=1 Tax=Tetrapyrgos nigripes TaxID=182062 RepID=A0A8H5FNL9_9AGAR|nr:hypothetical protein D9758_011165 [Tetrapyrgos nigripes]
MPRQRILQLEDQVEQQQPPPAKRARKSTVAANDDDAPVASGSTGGSSAASEKKKKAQLKKFFDRLSKECKSDNCKFQGSPKTIKLDEVLEENEFETIFKGKGTLIQPTPQNKPKSTVTVINFNDAQIQDLFGSMLKDLKGYRWSRGGVHTRTFGRGFGFGFGSSTFSKSMKQGACEVKIRTLHVEYSKNSMKCTLKFEVAEVGGDYYGDYDNYKLQLNNSYGMGLVLIPPKNPRWLSLSTSKSLASRELPLRTVVIKNFPPKAITPHYLALRGTGGPIESVKRHKERDRLEIRYLEASSAQYVSTMAQKYPGLRLNHQRLRVGLTRTHRLPVEVVAAIGLRGASRSVRLHNLTNNFTAKELETEFARFGEIDDVWFGRDPKAEKPHAVVTFCHLMAAVKAYKTARTEGWTVSFRKNLPTVFKTSDYEHHTVFIWFSSPITVQKLLQDMDFRFRNGDPIRAQVSGKNAFLTFSDPANAAKFYDSYEHPQATSKNWAIKDRTPRTAELAAVKLGASRTLFIDGFTDPRVNFDRLHEDFSKFGEIFYVFADLEKACAKVVFTNMASALKAIENIHENRSNYSVYRGARVTFGRLMDRVPHLRPLLIPDTYADSPVQAENESTFNQGNASPASVKSQLPEEPISVNAPYEGVKSGVLANIDESDDGYDLKSSYADEGEWEWIERLDLTNGRMRLDVMPARKAG